MPVDCTLAGAGRPCRLPTVRTRLGLGLVSLAVIGLELTLMRSLSLRFWSHFAYMVVGVALLGFGASGTAITLLRRRIVRNPRGWLCGFQQRQQCQQYTERISG